MKQKTKRGIFRNISMNKLQEIVEKFKWNNEGSRLHYTYPLPTSSNMIEVGQQIASSPTIIPAERLIKYGPFLTTNSPESHIGPFRHAIDFLVPDGTPILAAQSGTIIEIQESSTTWGDGTQYRDLLNYITIQHDGKIPEFSQYCHIEYGSVSHHGLEIGSRVSLGQQVGFVGKTGWTDRDHLHFIVFRSDKNPHGFKSLVPKFQ